MNRQRRQVVVYAILFLALILGYMYLENQVNSQSTYTMDALLQSLEAGKVNSARISQNREVPTGSVTLDIKELGERRLYVTDVKEVE